MKNKIAIASAFIAASSFSSAEIAINEFLSLEGFIDMSYVYTDAEATAAGDTASASDNSYQIDQVEIAFLFDFDPVTAQIDIQFEDIANSSDFEDGSDGNTVEQAFFTYHFSDGGGAITAGRFASFLGFEAFEPTGLYQYSFAYDIPGLADVAVIPFYHQGVKFTYENDTSFFGVSVVDSIYDNDDDRLGGPGESTYGIEAAGSIDLGNGFAWFLGGGFEDGDADDGDSFVLNTYVTFETGAWIFAGEISYGDYEPGFALVGALEEIDAIDFGSDEEVIQALIMANFAYSDQGSITGRFSWSDHEADSSIGDVEADFIKFTAAHGWAFTDNLFLVTEVNFVDGDVAGIDYEALQGALELIFAF
ncbi:MAG: outer membrane beta-barrel protein [Verrucomicrobiota bacterium]